MKLFQLAPIALCLGALSLPIAQPAFASGGTGGGGGTVCDTTPVLPTTSAAPDIFMRESFGMGPQYRPTGGKGCNKPVFAHTPLSGFWMEYPGSKNTVWLAAPETGQTWRFCAQTPDPYELPSPLQPVFGTDVMNGCVISDWFDPAQIAGEMPTAIIPLQRTAGAFQASVDGWPAPVAGTYVALGLTDSTLTQDNLATSAGVWLLLREVTLDNTLTAYELRLNGMTGPLLASGEFISQTYNRIAVRYDPATGMAGASLNEVDLGSFPAGLAATPKFVGFEGVGILDNFVVRSLP